MHGDHAGGHARHQDRRGPGAKRKRDLRAHQHQRLPAAARVSRSRSARNTIGGMPTPPPTSSVRGRVGMRREAVADRAEHAERFADACARRAPASPGPTILYSISIQPRRAIGAHDRQRPAHRHLGVAASDGRSCPAVARARRTCGAFRRKTNWSPREALCCARTRRVFDEDGAAMCAGVMPAFTAAASRLPRACTLRTIVASTAMRTATPLRDLLLDHRLRPVGHVAGDLDAAIHRAGVHARSRPGCASCERSRGDAELAKIRVVVRDLRFGHALALDAQRHHDVGAAQCPPSSDVEARRARRIRRHRASAPRAPRCRSSPTPSVVERLRGRACDARVTRRRRRWRP